MAIEKGRTAKIEEWIVSVLAALKYDGSDVFKTAESYTDQLEAGAEAFTRHVPFAFVSYWPADAAREGDCDLRDILRWAILLGAESKKAGVARIGSTSQVGISKIRDLVIDVIDKVHPGAGFDCDELYYVSETEMVDQPKRYATELHFQANWIV